MDLNTKIAERRAELQREEAAEIELRRSEERAQAQLRQAEEKAIQESVQKEAEQQIQAIESRLQGSATAEQDEPVSPAAQKKVDAHIRSLANKRFTKSENWKLGLLVFCCVIGFFMAWWAGVGMLIWTCIYSAKVTERHEAEIRAEIKKGT